VQRSKRFIASATSVVKCPAASPYLRGRLSGDGSPIDTIDRMRVVLQRVTQAAVSIDGKSKIVGEVGPGALVLVGMTHADGREQVEWMAKKIATMRIFPALDGPSGFDRSLLEVQGEVLAVSQFTLYGDTRGGRRPGFSTAARPEQAAPLFEYFVERLRVEGIARVATGVFGADMQVALVNDGPVTLIVETQ